MPFRSETFGRPRPLMSTAELGLLDRVWIGTPIGGSSGRSSGHCLSTPLSDVPRLEPTVEVSGSEPVFDVSLGTESLVSVVVVVVVVVVAEEAGASVVVLVDVDATDVVLVDATDGVVCAPARPAGTPIETTMLTASTAQIRWCTRFPQLV
jgi:hypothetical protein